MSKKNDFYLEKYVADDGSIQKRLKLFEYNGHKFMATKDGRLIPHEYAICLVGRIFNRYYDENGNLKVN